MIPNSRRWFLALACAALVSIPSVGSAAVGYSGRLLLDSGQPVPDSTYTFTVRIYTAATGGSLLYTQTFAGQAVQDGYFSLALTVDNDTTTLIGSILSTGITNYLEVQVGTETLAPRLLMAGVPWALKTP